MNIEWNKGTNTEANGIVSLGYFGGVYLYVVVTTEGELVAEVATADDLDETELWGGISDSETLAKADAVTLGRELASKSLIAAKLRAKAWGVEDAT